MFRTVTRNAVNKSVWRKKDYSWLPLNKHAMNIWLSSLRIRAHLSWRTGKHLHVLHVLRTYSTCSYPGYQDTTTYAALFANLCECLLVIVNPPFPSVGFPKQTSAESLNINLHSLNWKNIVGLRALESSWQFVLICQKFAFAAVFAAVLRKYLCFLSP